MPTKTSGRGPTATAPGFTMALDQWQKFLAHALLKRLDADVLESYASLLGSKYTLPRVVIADILLRPHATHHYTQDPRVPLYLQVLLKLGLVDVPSALRVLYKYSTLHTLLRREEEEEEEEEEASKGLGEKKDKLLLLPPPLRWDNSYRYDEVMFYALNKVVIQGGKGGGAIEDRIDAVRTMRVAALWMVSFAAAAAAVSRDAFGAIHTMQTKAEVESARAAFTALLVSLCESHVVLSALSVPEAKAVRKEVIDGLDSFVPSIMQVFPDIASRLEHFRSQTLASFDPFETTNRKSRMTNEAMAAEVNSYMDRIDLENFQIPEMPIIHSRAGLYIYLNAALVGRPLLDDHSFYGYLHNRYQGDLQATAVQLILASFDIVANAVYRNEGMRYGHVLKSYLVNKVPLVLRSLMASSTMYSFDPQYCITEALGQVDTGVFPTLSTMFDMSNTNTSFHDSIRQDFCFACQLHGMLSDAAIENLLGEITYQSLPDEGRYVKETLVRHCLQDADRALKLIGELDKMDGNVGAAAQALVEVLGRLCREKETMTLKQLCGQLASKPLTLDILLLFNKASRILHPLCDLLDTWRYDEDQGEYQPVYAEFGSILLLLMAMVYRYGLSPADLGIRSPDSFMAKLLTGGNSRPIEELSEHEQAHIGGWIHGLFDTDAGGLGDELMSSCPPQDFYLLIPTLFHQLVLALSTGMLSEDMVKSGFEYLMDAFLLPSLVPALLFLSDHLWADDGRPDQKAEQKDQKATTILRVLQLILLPSSISNEALTMLAAVLNIVAKPLEQSLRSYQRRDPKCQEIEPLLKALRENISLSKRTGGADHNELETWTSTPGGGLAAAVRNTIQSLIQWGQQTSLGGMPSTPYPTSYTHRQILAALKMLGARQVLGLILEELRQHTEAGSAGVAYDVATTLVCAPDVINDALVSEVGHLTHGAGVPFPAAPSPPQRRMLLREALKAEAADWKKLQKADPLMAETVVRLHRLVEAQMAVLPPPPPPPPPAASVLTADGLGISDAAALDDAIAAVAADAAAAAAAAGDSAAADAAALGLDTSGLDAASVLGSVTGDHLSGLASAGGAGGSAMGSAGGLDLGNDDIFSGLTGADFNADFSTWDGMDLG